MWDVCESGEWEGDLRIPGGGIFTFPGKMVIAWIRSVQVEIKG